MRISDWSSDVCSSDLLPDTQDGLKLRHAIEVRDESFRDPAFVEMVRERNMAIVYADSDEFPCIDEQTADFTYARLQRSQKEVETGYDAKEIGRASCRERVCPYVSISVVAVSLKKK